MSHEGDPPRVPSAPYLAIRSARSRALNAAPILNAPLYPVRTDKTQWCRAQAARQQAARQQAMVWWAKTSCAVWWSALGPLPEEHTRKRLLHSSIPTTCCACVVKLATRLQNSRLALQVPAQNVSVHQRPLQHAPAPRICACGAQPCRHKRAQMPLHSPLRVPQDFRRSTKHDLVQT